MHATPTDGRTRGERRDQAAADTRVAIISAARGCLLADGYASLSTRHVAESAGVPLSQIHYYFGSKRQLILTVLEAENERLLARQREMFAEPDPLWVRWELACDFLDTDVESGYVRILQEMIAAGWADAEVAAAVREMVGRWYAVLADVARRFLTAYGPARVEEFARWWGVQPKAVRPVLTADHGFTQVEVEGGKPAWTVPDAPVTTAEDAPVVRLLPLFDPYTVAARRHGERILVGADKDLVYRKAGWISPALLVDGEIAGVWEHKEEKGGLRVEVAPFGPVAPAIADLVAEEALRLAEYLGVSGDITVGGFVAGRGRKNLRRLSTREEAPG